MITWILIGLYGAAVLLSLLFFTWLFRSESDCSILSTAAALFWPLFLPFALLCMLSNFIRSRFE